MNSLELWSYWKEHLSDYLSDNGYVELAFLREVIEVEPDGYGGTDKVFYFEEGVFYTCLSHWDGVNSSANSSYAHMALNKETFSKILDIKKSTILYTLSKDEKIEFELIFNAVKTVILSKFE